MKKFTLLLLVGLIIKIVPWYVTVIVCFISGIVLLTLSFVTMVNKFKSNKVDKLKRVEKRLEKIRKQLEKATQPPTPTPVPTPVQPTPVPTPIPVPTPVQPTPVPTP